MLKIIRKFYHKKYFKSYRHAKKLFVIDIFLLLTTLVMAEASLFFFLWKPDMTHLIDLNISLSNKRISSGEYMAIGLEYNNRSELNLYDTSLAMELPKGFVLDREKTPLAYFSKNSIFHEIQSLPAGGNGEVKIFGWLWTEPENEEKITARFSYLPQQKERKEQKTASYLLKLSDSLIKLNLSAPSEAFSGQEIIYNYTLVNQSSQTVKIKLSPSWDEAATGSEDYEEFELKPEEILNASGKINTPAQSGTHELILTPFVKINGFDIKQTAAVQSLEIIKPDVLSSIKIDNASYAIQGERLTLKINWRNQSESDLKNLRLLIEADKPQIIDWNRTESSGEIINKNGKLILSDRALKNASKGVQETLNVNLYLKKDFGFLEKNAFLTLTPSVIMTDEFGDIQYKESGLSASLPVNGSLDWSVEPRYYTTSGDQLGRGPLPPKIGEKTVYWIFIRLKNGQNDLKTINFKAKLSEQSVSSGKNSVTAGNKMTYDADNKTWNWSYSGLEANGEVGLYFEIETAPSPDDKGKTIKLLDYLEAEGIDAMTGQKLKLYKTNLENILPNDDKGSLSGYFTR